MNNNFFKISKFLLLKFLKEPWAFSFFPSSFFWNKNIWKIDIDNSFKSYFQSKIINLDDRNNKLNLYIHIPFCGKICSYCNCFKKQLEHKKEIDIYLDYLEKEIKLIYLLNNRNKIKINTIFIWGWTPNILSIKQFDKLYSIILKYFDLEYLEQFLIDWHPNNYNKEKIKYFKGIWVNRLTFAIQTFDKETLKINNRDIYNKNIFKENIEYLKELWIKSNIDLLIWLKWQTFTSIKRDIDYIKKQNIDNISIHYMMNSNNIDYKLDSDYLNIISKTKKYLLNSKLPNFSSNIWEDYYASKRNTTISIWAFWVTNIYSNLIYIKPWIKEYYKQLELWILPFLKWFKLSKRDEMIKYIYLNILYWINILEFNQLFWENIFKIFKSEFKFLNNNKVIVLKENKVYSLKNNLDTLIYFNIFFLEKFSDLKLNNYNIEELGNFFLKSWELIDK